MSQKHLTRRDFLKATSALVAGAALASCAAPDPTKAPEAPKAPAGGAQPTAPAAAPAKVDVAKVDPISILINDSPWFPGFEKLVRLYEEKTKNTVKLAVTPFTGMLEKTRNATTAPESEFDLVNLNEGWYATFYEGKFMSNINEIDPNFKMDPNIIEYSYATRWDHAKKYSSKDGIIYGLPINGNIQLFYYRTDLYEKAGITKVPTTWEEVEEAAKKIQQPPNMYGYSMRGQKAGFAVAYDWLAYLRGYKGDWVAKPGEDWTVTINNAAGKKAAKKAVDMLKAYGPPNVADVGQAELIQLMQGGKLAQALMVVANFPNMDNPEKSAVVNKVNVAILPKPAEGQHATTTGIWVMGIPKNLPDKRKKAALTFLNWALTKDAQMEYTKFGAVPVRQDVYSSDLGKEPKFRWMKAMADSTPYIFESIRIPEGSQVTDSVELNINKAIAGQSTPEAAVDAMAKDIFDILTKAGYKAKMG